MSTPQLDRPKNAYARAGLVAALIGVAVGAIAPTPLSALALSSVFSVVAIMFGAIAVDLANRQDHPRHAEAAWAIVIGFAPFPAWVATSVLFTLVLEMPRPL